MTSDALMTAQASSPVLRLRSATASFVIADVMTMPLPMSIRTWDVVAPFLTSTILPLSWLRALSFFMVYSFQEFRVPSYCGSAGVAKPCFASTRWPSIDRMKSGERVGLRRAAVQHGEPVIGAARELDRQRNDLLAGILRPGFARTGAVGKKDVGL